MAPPSRQFLAFLVTGGIAALVNYGSRFVFSRWLSFSSAVILAYLVGMITAFLLARAFVFTDRRGSTAGSALRFTLVNVLAVAQTWLVSVLLARHGLPALGIDQHVEAIAHAVGVAVPVFTSFLGHKYWTFR